MVSSLEAGGAERVMVSLANRWAGQGHTVTIVTLAAGTNQTAYAVDPRVARVGLDLIAESRSIARGVMMNLRRAAALRRAIRDLAPDVVLGFNAQINILALVATLGLAVPTIISERIYPPAYPIGASWSALRRLVYRRATAVVVQTEEVRRWAEGLVRRERIHVIPNAVGPPFTDPAPLMTDRRPLVLGVGRLARQKGFDLLIRAFGSLAARHVDWSLVLVGEGPDRAALADLAAADGGARVTFTGRVADPERWYRSAAIFVLPSRFEGFPNALLEAMACGCAVIAANCPTGPAEIVRDGVDGRLVAPEDSHALARELDQLMIDRQARGRLGDRAREVAQRFAVESNGALWDAVLSRARG